MTEAQGFLHVSPQTEDAPLFDGCWCINTVCVPVCVALEANCELDLENNRKKHTSWSMSMNGEFRSFHLSEVNINQALGERYIPKPRPPPFLYHLPPPFHTSLDIIYNSDGGPVAVLPPWPWCTIMETTPNATTIDINMLPLVLHKPLFILSSTWLHLSVPTYSCTLSCRQPSLQWPTLSWVLCLCFF